MCMSKAYKLLWFPWEVLSTGKLVMHALQLGGVADLPVAMKLV